LGTPTSVAPPPQFAETNGWVSLKYYYLRRLRGRDEIRIKPNFIMTVGGCATNIRTPVQRHLTTTPGGPSTSPRASSSKLGEQIQNLNNADGNNFAASHWYRVFDSRQRTVVRARIRSLLRRRPRGSEFSSFPLSPPFVPSIRPWCPIRGFPNLIGATVSDPGRARPRPTHQILQSAERQRLLARSGGSARTIPTTGTLRFNAKSCTTRCWKSATFGNSAPQADWTRAGEPGGPAISDSHAADTGDQSPTQSQYCDVSLIAAIDNSSYHSLAAKLNKRFFPTEFLSWALTPIRR